MNDKKSRINEFLKFLADIAYQNPNLNFTGDQIYHELINLGLPANERDCDVSRYFPRWIKFFSKDPKSHVFVDQNWRYFCQFLSTDDKAARGEEHLKIYVPLDSKHIERGAKEIFEFLSNAGISHASKIGKHIRFDDVVIRLIEPNDVYLLMDFLKNNKYIQEGLLPANPFTFSFNGIPMAVDGTLSFNSTVASMISIYINEKKNNNDLRTVNADDFYNFLEYYYNNVFANIKGLNKLEKDFPWLERRFATKEHQYVNYQNIFELMLNSIKADFTFDDYLEHYRKCRDFYEQQIKIEDLKTKYSRQLGDGVLDSEIKKTNEMLLQIIDVMNEKYNDKHFVLSNIEGYIKTGDETYITRYKNLRDIVFRSTFRQDLIKLLASNHIEFFDYAESLLSNRKQMFLTQNTSEVEARSTIEKQVIVFVKEILEIMSNKYGENMAYENLENFVNTGNYAMLTRDFNLRERVANSTFRMDLKQILAQRQVSLNNYLVAVVGASVTHAEVYLENAILETYSKYESQYLDGTCEYSGKDFVVGALSQLIKQGHYDGFTRDNDARINLKNNVSVNSIINIIKNEFGIKNDQDIPHNYVVQLVEQYISRVLENNPQIKL